MFAIGNLLISIAKILSMATTIYTYIIIGVVIISWVGADPYNPIVRFLRQATEPVFYQVRKILPRALFRTGLDFTPLIVLVLLVLFENVVINLLYQYGASLLKVP
jgi:YggT family protein